MGGIPQGFIELVQMGSTLIDVFITDIVGSILQLRAALSV